MENTSGQSIEAQISDQTGRPMHDIILVPGQTKIDCGKLAAGMYHLEIQSQGVKILKRFVIER
ncbi:hypothetical protein D3C86_1888740 [compost metagenome]